LERVHLRVDTLNVPIENPDILRRGTPEEEKPHPQKNPFPDPFHRYHRLYLRFLRTSRQDQPKPEDEAKNENAATFSEHDGPP
jgi:hypothetical protein